MTTHVHVMKTICSSWKAIGFVMENAACQLGIFEHHLDKTECTAGTTHEGLHSAKCEASSSAERLLFQLGRL